MFLRQASRKSNHLHHIIHLRYWLFEKNQAESERLQPTPGALHQAILRCHHQAIVRNNDIIPRPKLPSPEVYGWNSDGDRQTPVKTT